MPSSKRNKYLEADDSDEDELEQGYDSDNAEESRGALAGHTSKRRKVGQDSNADSFDGFDAPQDEVVVLGTRDRVGHGGYDPEDGVGGAELDDEDATLGINDRPRKSSGTATLKVSTPKQVTAAQKAVRRTGVIYLSRIPPFMKPQTLKHFLAPHAPKGLGRIFLTPEDHTAHQRRVKSGGNKKKSFTDGWVEFVSKKEAKIAAETLNGNIIGGKKGNFYHDDLWNMKYLKGFKWSHLTEQIANENAERQARLREEIRRTRKENKAFLDDVERGKMLDGMEAKKTAKHKKAVGDESVEVLPSQKPLRNSGRKFTQRKVQVRGTKQGGYEQPDEVSRVLSKIF